MSDESGFMPENLPGFGAHHDNRVQNLSVTLLNPTSKRLLTETRFGFARMRLHRYGETANGADLVTELGVTGVWYGGSDAYGLPRFDIQGYDPIGSVIYQVPFSTAGGSPTAARIVHGLLGGWQASLIYQWQSGFPFTISIFGDTANAGALLNVNPIRANVVPGISPELPSDHRSADMWFNTAASPRRRRFTFGTATRNSVWGPNLSKADLALDRAIPVGTTQLHVRMEAFNLLNAVNYGTPNRFVSTPQFGTTTEAATSARQTQFVLLSDLRPSDSPTAHSLPLVR